MMKPVLATCLVALLAGCAGGSSTINADLNAAFSVAAAAEAAYAAQPGAAPAVVAEMQRLLAAAQAALLAWNQSGAQTDQAIADAAIAALMSYEASAPKVTA